MTDEQAEHVQLLRELGRRLFVYLDAVAGELPPRVIVDALMAVAMSFTVAADLDEEQLAENWLRATKEAKRKEGK